MLAAFLCQSSSRRLSIKRRRIEDKDPVARHAHQLRSLDPSIERSICTNKVGSTTVFQLICQLSRDLRWVCAGEDTACTDCSKEDDWKEEVIATEEEYSIAFLEELRLLETERKSLTP